MCLRRVGSLPLWGFEVGVRGFGGGWDGENEAVSGEIYPLWWKRIVVVNV